MDSLPPRYGEAYERVKNAGGRKNRDSSGNLREQVIHSLPTPTVSDQYTGNLKSSQQKEGSLHSVTLAQIVNRSDLLPTPNTMEHREIKTPEQIAELKKRSPGGYRNLRESVINDLLPTPIVDDSKNNGANENRIEGLSSVVYKTEVSQNWGRFQPAISSWELVTGRQAPSPTKADAKDGSSRLSSSFAEWLMGVPEGWITGVGLTRAEELKAAGNGVVPQQAYLALEILLGAKS